MLPKNKFSLAAQQSGGKGRGRRALRDRLAALADERAVDDQEAEVLAALVHGLLLQDLSPPITYEVMKIGN